ncbi:MAG: glycogen synthase GlgA [Deltaproteobacteria bacterium]|nr:glycogen synthase GlgA [Deltaproteobacteria bacterium]
MPERTISTIQEVRQLRRLSRLYNIETAYWDIFGNRKQASPESLIQLLRALGAPLNHLSDVDDALRERRQSLWRQVVEPVLVAWNGTLTGLRLRVPSSLAGGPIECRVRLENGKSIIGKLSGERSDRNYLREVEGIKYVRLNIAFSARLPFGYHQLRLQIGKDSYESFLISAPLQAYSAPKSSDRQWGIFLPLYALWSQANWGAGDFSDLGRLMDWVKDLGGSIIGTLPLLPTFLSDSPFDPSPYAPVSRLFWNEFYLDVTRIPELFSCGPALELMNSADFQDELRTFRSTPLVDYRRQIEMKRRVMERLAGYFFNERLEEQDAFRKFVEGSPAVEDYARFRAATEKQRKPWTEWPMSNRQGVLNEDDYEQNNKLYHLYVQWQAEKQLSALDEKAHRDGLSLYLDFPLGVNRDGYDVWRQRDVFALGASGGAPPDDFFRGGQNWGFPPLHPEKLRQDHYRYHIACLRHHLKYAGLLRIDHIMGWHHLFWIPLGLDASDGVYVRYRAEEFYAMLTLESHRYKTSIVGENLGTVPPAVNSALARHQILGMSVGEFEVNSDPERAAGNIPPHSVLYLNTHDAATFAGFWQGLDIENRASMGLLNEESAAVERASRQKVKESLTAFLQRHDFLKSNGGDPLAVLHAWLLYLSSSPAPVVLVNAEDLWLESSPQNVPGTWDERPNWRQKARYSLEEFTQKADVRDFLKEFDSLRRRHRDDAGGFGVGKPGRRESAPRSRRDEARSMVRSKTAPTAGSRSDSQMHVAIISPEISPFAKTGGLADMVGSLAIALERLGLRVTLVMPAYRSFLASDHAVAETAINISVPVSDRQVEGSVLKAKLGQEIQVYLIRCDPYFDRPHLYGDPSGDYPDNCERFVFFSRAALEILRADPPGILHCHDWQSALALAFLRAQPERYPELSRTGAVFTVHNLGYQGLFWHFDWHFLNLDWKWFTPRFLEFFGKINVLKGGVIFADRIATVSPTYAREIQTREQGFGLEGIFQERAGNLVGILNGVDYGMWNPQTDPFIAEKYGPRNLSGKKACKSDLQRSLNLPERPDIPLLGMVSRFSSQKGFDLLAGSLDTLFQREIQFVLLGSGDKRYADLFSTLFTRYPGKGVLRIGFDEVLAHKIEAGADVFLMPSLYEPCGLNQIYSLKYGTVPVVRATGGLRDTVEEADPAGRRGTGFLFEPFKGEAFLAALDRALALYPNKRLWSSLMKRGMAANFSWNRSARAYCDLYQAVLSSAHNGVRL